MDAEGTTLPRITPGGLDPRIDPTPHSEEEIPMKKILRMPLSAVFVAPLLALSLPSLANECPIAGPYEPCTGCHVPGLNPNVELAYNTWSASEHLNGVTFGPDFCKNCHQPFRADPADCDLLAPDRANGIECATCHTERF